MKLFTAVCFGISIAVIVFGGGFCLLRAWWRKHHSPTIRIMRYSFTVAGKLIIGTPSDFECDNAPAVDLIVQRLIVNVPPGGGVLFSIDIQKENGEWQTYAISYEGIAFSPHAKGELVTPFMVRKDQKVRVRFCYDGTVWEGFQKDAPYTLICSMKGPTEIVPGTGK